MYWKSSFNIIFSSTSSPSFSDYRWSWYSFSLSNVCLHRQSIHPSAVHIIFDSWKTHWKVVTRHNFVIQTLRKQTLKIFQYFKLKTFHFLHCSTHLYFFPVCILAVSCFIPLCIPSELNICLPYTLKHDWIPVFTVFCKCRRKYGFEITVWWIC